MIFLEGYMDNITIKLTPSQAKSLKKVIIEQRAVYINLKSPDYNVGVSESGLARVTEFYDERIAVLNAVYAQIGGEPDV